MARERASIEADFVRSPRFSVGAAMTTGLFRSKGGGGFL